MVVIYLSRSKTYLPLVLLNCSSGNLNILFSEAKSNEELKSFFFIIINLFLCIRISNVYTYEEERFKFNLIGDVNAVTSNKTIFQPI